MDLYLDEHYRVKNVKRENGENIIRLDKSICTCNPTNTLTIMYEDVKMYNERGKSGVRFRSKPSNNVNNRHVN